MPDKPQKRERQTTLRESDDRIVPLKREDQSRGSKPGNAGAGKAVRPSREPGAGTDRTQRWTLGANAAGSHHQTSGNASRRARSTTSSRC